MCENMDINEEIRKYKVRIKQLKKLKRMMKKSDRMKNRIYRPQPYFVFVDCIDAIIGLIKKEKS